MVHEIKTLEDFTASISNKDTSLVVVDFFADWCGPCKMIAPKFAKLAEKYPNISCCKVNSDNEDMQEACKACNISSLPTFCFFRGGKYIAKMSGSNAENLEKLMIQHSAAGSSK